MRFPLLALALIAVASCGADPVDPSKPDMVMRDAPVQPNECMNGLTDGEETDQDCGGPTCSPCADGKSCKMGRDCASTFCTNNICDAASCMDGAKNGSESDQDCGGSCPGCAVGKKCNAGGDCVSMTCTNGMCALGQCEDGKQNGAETDVDCGGGTCPACGDGKMCQQGSDCVGMTCTNNVCKGALTCMAGTADCDGNAVNGCEVNTNTDAKNCGACGKNCPMNTPNCAAARCIAGTTVLLVHSYGPAAKFITDVQAKLMATGAFAAVDAFDAGAATPSVNQLQAYQVVLVSSNDQLANPSLVGDNLATYFDGGGRVVVAASSLITNGGYRIEGRFGTVANGYLLMTPGPQEYPRDSLGTINNPMHPLVSGVKALSATMAFRASVSVANGGTVIAEWSSQKRPLIVSGVVKGRNRVDVNLFPPSSDARADLWTGDGAVILRNALLYQ